MKAISSLAAILVGLFEGNLLKGVQTYVDAMDVAAGRKVFEFFKQFPSANQTHQQQSSQQRQREVFDYGVLNAYQLLNVSPNASDDEVKKARNNALKASHPDVSGLNPEVCHQLTVEINNAYELVRKSRALKRMAHETLSRILQACRVGIVTRKIIPASSMTTRLSYCPYPIKILMLCDYCTGFTNTESALLNVLDNITPCVSGGLPRIV